MQRLSTQHARSTISKMIPGVELLILTLRETQLQVASSTINTSTFSLVEPSLIRKKSLTLLRCTISTLTCGVLSTYMPSLLGLLVI